MLKVKCPPTPVQPEGRLVFGYHRTLNCRGRGSPITILVGGSREIEYAVAAAMVPGATLFGAACTSTFRFVLTCRWLSCNVPANATTIGVYISLKLPCPSVSSVVPFSNSSFSAEGGNGFVGIRHVSGASL